MKYEYFKGTGDILADGFAAFVRPLMEATAPVERLFTSEEVDVVVEGLKILKETGERQHDPLLQGMSKASG